MKKIKPPLERDIEKAIQDAFWCKFRVKLWKIDSGCAGMRRGSVGYSTMPPGFPDLLGVIHPSGRVLAIECKRPGNKPTEQQQAFLDVITKSGGVALWADSVDVAISKFSSAINNTEFKQL